MAKRRTVGDMTQSDAIRAGWQALGRRARGREVIAYVDEHYPSFGLGKKTGASPMVSQMKAKVFGRRGKRSKKKTIKARRAATRNVRSDGTQDVRLLIQAREFVSKCGSVDQAITVLKQLRELQLSR